jgi:hypothetical protein
LYGLIEPELIDMWHPLPSRATLKNIFAVLVIIAMNVLFVAFIFTVLYIILKPPSSNEGLFDLFVATMGVVMLLVSVWPEEHSPVWPYRA